MRTFLIITQLIIGFVMMELWEDRAREVREEKAAEVFAASVVALSRRSVCTRLCAFSLPRRVDAAAKNGGWGESREARWLTRSRDRKVYATAHSELRRALEVWTCARGFLGRRRSDPLWQLAVSHAPHTHTEQSLLRWIPRVEIISGVV